MWAIWVSFKDIFSSSSFFFPLLFYNMGLFHLMELTGNYFDYGGEKCLEKEKSWEKKLKRTVDSISRGGGQRGRAQIWNTRFCFKHFSPPQTTESWGKEESWSAKRWKKSGTRCHKCRPVFKKVFILGSLTYLTGRRGQSQEGKCVEGSQQKK